MSQLDEIQALATDNTAGEFSISGNSLAVLFYALDFVQNLDNWRDYADEELSSSDIDDIRALVDGATDELMRPIMAIPVGVTMTWHTDTPPDRWLICDGSGVLKTEYPELYALLGDKYGSSVDFFGLPDLTGRSPFGANFSYPLDGTAGALTHTLTTGELPAHTHPITDAGHTHPPSGGATVFQGSVSGGSTAFSAALAGQTRIQMANTGSNTTGITVNNNTGGGGAHNNLHPILGVHFIIYAGN